MSAACTSKHEMVLFSSGRSGNSDIYMMRSDGSELVQLTTDPTEEWSPVWINTAEVAFLRQSQNEITRHKLNVKTGIETELAHPPDCVLDDKNMLYNSDGSKALYACDQDIYLLKLSTNAVINLTRSLNGTSAYPVWTSDEKRVVFTNNQSGSNDIYSIDINDQSIETLAAFSSNDERGSISPDGKYLIFSSDKFEKGNQDILLMDLASGNLENIAANKGIELIARWSPDGKSIYLGSTRDGNWELYAYDLRKQQMTRLTDHPGFDGDPRPYLVK